LTAAEFAARAQLHLMLVDVITALRRYLVRLGSGMAELLETLLPPFFAVARS
jgi:hypothetical protein